MYRFHTPVYHPNVNNDGKICLSILNASWSPSVTTDRVLKDILDLLENPCPLNALDVVKANLYSDNKEEFTRQAVHHTLTQASNTIEELKTMFNIL
jgi:ubiquitin-conjugating enzyme E2 D/E